MNSYTIPPELAGQRLDAAVAALQSGLSRAYGQQLIAAGQVRLNGAPAKPSARLKAGDQVTVEIPPLAPVATQPEAIPLTIVFEDEAVLVVDKPAGLVVHPAPGHATGTLV